MFLGMMYLLWVQHHCLSTRGVMLLGFPARTGLYHEKSSLGDRAFPFLFPSKTTSLQTVSRQVTFKKVACKVKIARFAKQTQSSYITVFQVLQNHRIL